MFVMLDPHSLKDQHHSQDHTRDVEEEASNALVYVDSIGAHSAQTPSGYRLLLWEPLLEHPWSIPPSREQPVSAERVDKRQKRRKTSDSQRQGVAGLQERIERCIRTSYQQWLIVAETEKPKHLQNFVCRAPSGSLCMADELRRIETARTMEEDYLRAWNRRANRKGQGQVEEEALRSFESPLTLTLGKEMICDTMMVAERLVLNPSESDEAWIHIERRESQEGQRSQLCLPSKSGFLWTNLLGDRALPLGWHGLLSFAQCTAPVDLILLDPPYPNGSAERARRKRSSYEPVTDLYDLWQLRQPVQTLIDSLPTTKSKSKRSPHPFIACWVTNHAKVQAFVLEKLFPAWNVQHIGQLVWLKLAIDGKSVFPLDNAQGRKPYEVLLIGQVKRTATEWECKKHINGKDKVFTKVVGSIPTAHSRKPPIVDLLRSRLHAEGYEASEGPWNVYEFFARSVMAGLGATRDGDGEKKGYWISMGNEPCSFNQLDVGIVKDAGERAE